MFGLFLGQDSISRSTVDDHERLYSPDLQDHSPNDLQIDEERIGLSRTTAEDPAGLWSRLWFAWVGPLMTFGASGKLNTAQQLFQLPQKLRTETVERQFKQFILRSGDMDDYDVINNRNHKGSHGSHCVVVPDFSSYSVEINYGDISAEEVDEVGEENCHYCNSRELATQRIEGMENNPRSVNTMSSSLLTALNRAFGCEYYSIGILKFLTDAMSFSGPILLNLLVSYMEETGVDSQPSWHGYAYACALSLTTFIGALFNTHYNYLVNRVGYKMRAAVITSIYRKTLSVSYADLSAFSSGIHFCLLSVSVSVSNIS